MQRGRAYRRHHDERIHNRFRIIVTHCWGFDRDIEWIEWAVRKWANTRKPCSCSGCGNQRRHEGPPVRELRHLQKSVAGLSSG
jgi:hypothetical protein